MAADNQEHRRLCDFCGDSTAHLYCRADSAKLCLSCDREVHSTNQLFTKHSRSLLCDICDSSPASIFCSTDASVLCQNCDWESHNRSLSPLHDRRPLDGFTGCPSVSELSAILGFEDLGKKDLFRLDDGLKDADEEYEFSDYMVWDTPSIVSLDEIIVPNDSGHSYQTMVMGVPPLPKNRNAACGQHKEEILCQLREMSKVEPNFIRDHGDIEPLARYHLPELREYHQDVGMDHNRNPALVRPCEASPIKGCSESGEVADPYSSTFLGSYTDCNSLVPDKDFESSIHMTVSSEGEFHHSANPETFQVLPKVAVRELNSQERETALSRYKEKKKNRRFDKHIRYESRKIRAESRTRIKGRFAKIERSDIAGH